MTSDIRGTLSRSINFLLYELGTDRHRTIVYRQDKDIPVDHTDNEKCNETFWLSLLYCSEDFPNRSRFLVDMGRRIIDFIMKLLVSHMSFQYVSSFKR